NDELGHAVGDAVLVEVASVIRAEAGPEALAGRLGGEEFVLLLPRADFARGHAFAERLRQAIARLPALPARTPGAPPVRTTASLGVVAFDEGGGSLDLLLSQADAAMYCAKTAGRNR